MNVRLISSLIMSGLALNIAHAEQPVIGKDHLPKLEAEAQHMTASQRLTKLYTHSHYKHFKLDDSLSEGIFERYLSEIDYNRYIFTREDIEQFEKYSDKLDDQLKAGKTDTAFMIYNRSITRRYERYVYALSLLEKEIKFDDDGDEIELDRSEASWPLDKYELNILWDKRVKYEALNLALTDKKWPEIKKILSKRYKSAIKRLVQTHNEDVFQMYMNAFSREIDPHTSYLSPRTAERFQSEMNLSLEGIGAVLRENEDYTVIDSLIAGGPAAKTKKLDIGDRIIGVGQETGDIVDVMGWRLDDTVDLIKGHKGTKVRLQILPKGSDVKSHIVTIVRDKIRLEDNAVKSKIVTYKLKKIGVLEVPNFYVGLAKDTDKLIKKLKKQKVSGIVVDLRNNGGGALTEAIALSGLFIESGPIVQVRDSYDRVEVNKDEDKSVAYSGPLTVLINRYSASASEIFAAAMQDYQRAVILGEQSFGKGTVQQHRSLNHIYDMFREPLGHVQYTIQKFYRVNGGSTQNKGVHPDILFPSPIDPAETGESVEVHALPWDKIKKANYKVLPRNKKFIETLTNKHKKRISSDREFKFIEEDIAKYQSEKDEKYVSLHLKERQKEMKDADAMRLKRINMRQKAKGKSTFKSLDAVPKNHKVPDAYLDEAAAVTVDLASVKKK